MSRYRKRDPALYGSSLLRLQRGGPFYLAGEHVLLQSACGRHLLRLLRTIATSCGWIASMDLSLSDAGRGLLVFLCSIVIESA